jgi:dihydroxyacetone kinase-like protein
MAVETKPRKFMNDPADLVSESLAGLAAAHPDLLRYDAAARIVVRKGAPKQGKVALISGGGSGHVDGGAGVVHIVKNYTGDVLNFKMAAEDAADDGIKVTSIVIDDDVAVQDSLYTAGRRGVGATVLAEKIAGAAAEAGADLATVADTVKRVNDRARSFGVALSSCIPPASGKPIFDLPEGQIELGIGIHGEPGRRRASLGSASEVVDVMVEAVMSDLKARSGAPVLVFVNGMGGTPLIELYLIYNEVDRKLRAAGVEPVRNLVGSYITSLEMAGASLTVLELDDELTRLWDAPVHTPALRWGI